MVITIVSIRSVMRAVSIPTSDDSVLEGFVFQQENANGVTILHGATGVPAKYYFPFAQWLQAEQNEIVLVYNYRDSNLPPKKLAKSPIKMSDWGIDDQSAVLDFVLAAYPDMPVKTIGHSLGGMCLPYHRSAHRVQRHIAVNSGPALWWAHPWHFIPQVILFWFLLGPLATWILGYMPGKRLGLNMDLPPQVYWQWRRWCTNPGFFEIDWGKVIVKPDFSRVRCPVHLVSVSDDVMIPPNRVRELARYYPHADISYREIIPSKSGLKSIGHIGIFSSRCSSVWPQMLL